MAKSIYSDTHYKIRKKLVDLRLKANLTQQQLADKLGTNQTYVSKYEIGERRLDIEEFLQIAKAIGFKASKFIEEIEKNK